MEPNISKSQVCRREREPAAADLGEKGRKIFAETPVKIAGAEKSLFARPPKGQLSAAAACRGAAEI